MQLERLAYCSTAKIGMESLLAVTDILAVYQRNNARDNLTGALVYSDGKFFQVVEGSQVNVDRALERIRADPRHEDIEVVLRQTVKARLFSGWSMTVPRVRPELAPKLRAAVSECHQSPHIAIELLRRLVDDLAVSSSR